MTTEEDLVTHEAPKDATPKIRAPRIPKPERVSATTHTGHDVDRRRRIHYVQHCRACQLDDSKRRNRDTESQVPEEDLYKTIFLVPDYSPERHIAELYLRQRYPRAQNIGSSINYTLVPQMPDLQIVVVCRRPEPGMLLKPHVRSILRPDNKWEEQQVPHSELEPEVLESAPITIGDCVHVSPMSLTTAQSVNTDELVERLAEVTPGFRIFRQNPPDQLIVLQAQ